MKPTLLLALTLLACGDPIVDASWRGEALYSLTGRVEVDFIVPEQCGDADETCWLACDDLQDEAPDGDTCGCEAAYSACLETHHNQAERPWETQPERLRLAIFWTQDGLEDLTSETGLVEQGGQIVGRFPGLFDLNLYRPPPAHVLRTATGGGQYALAAMALYLDDDRDGRWRAAQDRLVGGGRNQAIVYSPTGFTDARLGTRPAGWARITLEINCEDEALTVADTAAGPLRLSLTTAQEGLEAVLIDYDCDGSFEDACSEPGFVDYCQEAFDDDPECALCFDSDVN